MNWVIIVLLLLSIVGSMLWMMPSPKQRKQAQLRQQAMRTGFQVQMTRMLFPRAIGESVPDEQSCIAYRLPRHAGERKNRQATIPWHVFRLDSHATTGLPEGWCWSKGEGYLQPPQLATLGEIIAELPGDAFSLESTPVAVSVYWWEEGTSDTVDNLHRLLQRLIDEHI